LFPPFWRISVPLLTSHSQNSVLQLPVFRITLDMQRSPYVPPHTSGVPLPPPCPWRSPILDEYTLLTSCKSDLRIIIATARQIFFSSDLPAPLGLVLFTLSEASSPFRQLSNENIKFLVISLFRNSEPDGPRSPSLPFQSPPLYDDACPYLQQSCCGVPPKIVAKIATFPSME